MAVLTSVDVIETALWPQGDIRDPLGTWGARVLLVGDASGGSLKALIEVAADKRSSYLYTFYSAILAQVAGSAANNNIKLRILTNWPNIDPQGGVQAYGSAIFHSSSGADNDFTAPSSGPSIDLVGANHRFLLCFDPRQQETLGVMIIGEIELGSNLGVGTDWVAECYGYFWDRSVVNAPGGPRHPGSS